MSIPDSLTVRGQSFDMPVISGAFKLRKESMCVPMCVFEHTYIVT